MRSGTSTTEWTRCTRQCLRSGHRDRRRDRVGIHHKRDKWSRFAFLRLDRIEAMLRDIQKRLDH